MKPRAYFRVSPALLAQALHVPEGAEVVGVDWDWQRQSIRVYVADDRFPHRFDGEVLPERRVLVTCYTREPLPNDRFHSYTSEWVK